MSSLLASAPLVVALLSVACRGEAIGPTTLPGGVEWVEWPTAISTDQPGTIRVSGAPDCPQYTFFGVSVNGSELDVTATVDFSRGCITRPDTLLALPRLTPPRSGLPARFTVRAPVVDFSNVGPFATNDRLLGEIELRATPDTTTLFAGIAFVYHDSLGCWRAIPQRSGKPIWTFARQLPLVSESSGRVAYLRGRRVPVTPPVCGDTLAIEVFALEIDAKPRATTTPLLGRPPSPVPDDDSAFVPSNKRLKLAARVDYGT